VTVTASDGAASVADTFDLVLTPVNDAPKALNDQGFAAVGTTALSIAGALLMANDSDPDGDPLSITGVSQAAHGAVTLATNGAITYTAAAGFVGTDTFTYTVSDGRLIASATVSVSVSAPLDPYAGWYRGTSGADLLFADLLCVNRIYGREGDDTIFGRILQADSLAGGTGADWLTGLGGADDLHGNEGADTLDGGFGADTLTGGSGNDLLVGGCDGDRFVFAAQFGIDKIRDFEIGDRIVIDIAGFDRFTDLAGRFVRSGCDTVIDLGAGQKVTLLGTLPGELHATDFVFI
jgi:Ca2+-binding RTX toxin-like protein